MCRTEKFSFSLYARVRKGPQAFAINPYEGPCRTKRGLSQRNKAFVTCFSLEKLVFFCLQVFSTIVGRYSSQPLSWIHLHRTISLQLLYICRKVRERERSVTDTSCDISSSCCFYSQNRVVCVTQVKNSNQSKIFRPVKNYKYMFFLTTNFIHN